MGMGMKNTFKKHINVGMAMGIISVGV